MASMREDIAEILLDEASIARRVRQMGEQIAADYADKDLLLLATLKGAVVFLADLMRCIDLPVCADFVSAASYGNNTTSSGEIRVDFETCGDMRDKHVLIVEDIIDTGRTLTVLVERIKSHQAASVKTCCLLDKPSRRIAHLKPDYVGFEIDDLFVVGYGLDFAQKYRNLPFVAVLRADAYK